MLTKSAPARIIKSLTAGDPEGTFEAIVSVFGNVDAYGDVVMPGAFAETLAEWKASGDPIPVLWSHNSSDPDYHIGTVVEAKETDEGLYVKAELDLEGPGKARQVQRLLKGSRVTQFSFAYDVLDAAFAERDGQDVYELRRLKLYEVGPTLIGANQETRLIGAKSDDSPVLGAVHALHGAAAEIKAGRELSAATRAEIRTAVGELSTVLGASDRTTTTDKTTTTDSKQATADEPATDEPDGAKSGEPMRRSPASALSGCHALLADLATD